VQFFADFVVLICCSFLHLWYETKCLNAIDNETSDSASYHDPFTRDNNCMTTDWSKDCSAVNSVLLATNFLSTLSRQLAESRNAWR